MAKKRPLYFDCDPGVGDALALAYLLSSSEVSLAGIGTICGSVNVEHTTENALRLLVLAGRQDVPVTMGERCYLTHEYTYRAVQIHDANGIGDVELPPNDLAPTGEPAVEMILHLSDEYKGKLRICTVGLLTGLARALGLDPSLPQRVKQVVVVGGAALVPGNVSPVVEANTFCDPEAASAVVRAPWDVTLVGLDVTLGNVMEESRREQLLVSDQSFVGVLGRIPDVYCDFYQPQFGRRCSPLHNPLAVAIAVGTVRVVDSSWVNVIVDDTEGPGRGQTIADLRGQRLGPVDQEGAHVCMILKTDRPFADRLVARILGREQSS